MIFEELKLKGVFKIEIEKIKDERGFFTRIWDKQEFLKKGIDSDFVQ